MTLELPIVLAFRDLPYGRFGRCATPACGRRAFVRGRNNDSLVCIECFEFEHDGRAPNYRRRHAEPRTEARATP